MGSSLPPPRSTYANTARRGGGGSSDIGSPSSAAAFVTCAFATCLPVGLAPRRPAGWGGRLTSVPPAAAAGAAVPAAVEREAMAPTSWASPPQMRPTTRSEEEALPRSAWGGSASSSSPRP
eukprot:scaffold15189_cov55-Phaeocystis_antarctica.AAC.3